VKDFRLRASGFGKGVWAAAVVAFAVAAACSSAPPRGPMSDGERTYRAKCSACHRVYQPSEQTPAQWVKTLDKMEALKKVTLTPEERAQILQYLSGGAAAPLR
jgi:mono/diheme cytochrome c family protein